MQTVSLSEAALTLLRRRLAAEWVAVTEENRPLYRELVEAGLMYPVSTFLHGKEGYYRPTDAACDLRDGITASSLSTRPPLPAGSPSPGG
jgi:hypothetical protein